MSCRREPKAPSPGAELLEERLRITCSSQIITNMPEQRLDCLRQRTVCPNSGPGQPERAFVNATQERT